MKEGKIFLRGLAPTERTTDKERADLEKSWETAHPFITDISNAQSYNSLYQAIVDILPSNLKKVGTGKSQKEKLEVWANTPLNSINYDEGLLLELSDGKFRSPAAQMQHEFQEALKAKLKALAEKRAHLKVMPGESEQEQVS